MLFRSWEQYIKRRASGQGPELFVNHEDAKEWLKQCAPLNYVDGAWLCHIHKITTPFALRGVTKDAWQTFSEELGDGELEKNHVFLYKNLLRDIGIDLPDGDNADFTHARHGMKDDQIWKAATAQLLISLFPNDFLPEVLGFNMHFERLSVQTLKASKELPEFGISGYYFALHVSIDNSDSGHSAMALATVIRFLSIVKETGLMNVQEAWKRIQAGYLLSQSFEDKATLQMYESRVADILRNKACLSRKIHCTSRVRIGQRSLEAWLSSHSCNGSSGWKQDFLNALANARPWIYKGNSSKSLFMRELSWKGRMFGAFTNSEVESIRTWIDSLETDNANYQERYWQTVGRHEHKEAPFALSSQDPAVDHPAFPPQQKLHKIEKHRHIFTTRPALQASKVQLDALLPIWFVHPCLLDNMVSSPYQTATPLASHILRILRAESGYKPETSGIAGMDEQLHPSYNPGLIVIGLEMVRWHQLPDPTCLKDVLGEENAEGASHVTIFAYAVLSWAMRPVQNGAFLLGLARAFLDLEVWVASRDDLLPKKTREGLRRLVKRKECCFEGCLEELKANVHKYSEFVGGYELGRTEIEKALEYAE